MYADSVTFRQRLHFSFAPCAVCTGRRPTHVYKLVPKSRSQQERECNHHRTLVTHIILYIRRFLESAQSFHRTTRKYSYNRVVRVTERASFSCSNKKVAGRKVSPAMAGPVPPALLHRANKNRRVIRQCLTVV